MSRFWLVIVLVLGMSLLSMASGRPGDFEAGLIGGAIGATAGIAIMLVERLGRWLGPKAAPRATEDSGRKS